MVPVSSLNLTVIALTKSWMYMAPTLLFYKKRYLYFRSLKELAAQAEASFFNVAYEDAFVKFDLYRERAPNEHYV